MIDPVKLFKRLHTSVRYKLLLMVLVPLLVALPVLIIILSLFGGRAYDRLLVDKIRSDLAVANGYFERVQDGVGRDVSLLATSAGLSRALDRGDGAALAQFLQKSKPSLQLDFLYFADARTAQGASVEEMPLVRDALEGRLRTALVRLEAEALSRIDPRLAERAQVSLVETRNAAPTDRMVETRGLLIETAAPVYDHEGRIRGALVGGLLLNRNLQFVDHLNQIIYPEGSLPPEGHGTATLFLDDVRIATNVRLFDDAQDQARAIGTRVSAAVRKRVLEEGERWLDRAFVVNDWYVSGYQPLTDVSGARIGMLYVGYLEAPFLATKRWAIAGVILLFAAAITLATVLLLRGARSIFKPLERMNEAMNAIESGDTNARVGKLASADEIGQLASHFDQLLDRLHEQTESLQRWGAQLDAKVAERTRELEQSHQHLRETQRRLVMTEKLAAIGELTAGVAHEINNPVAVIQGNLDVVREVLGAKAEPVKYELRLMDNQVERIRLIVAKLLQFARPTEFAGYTEPVAARAAIVDSLLLVGHLMKRGHIAVVQKIETERQVTINRNELQQVLINLFVNAIQAMPDGGSLTLSARDWNENGQAKGIVIAVEDSGVGISPENIDRIFDPFFSTKGSGTGLGLSVSYGLVERYGGRIAVTSAEGKGSTFTVWLRDSKILCIND